MKRINRRQSRTETMRKALPELAVISADKIRQGAKKLAQAQYTNLCAKEDAANWLKVCSAFKEAGLMYSPAYWAAHSAFSGQRYWAINNWRTEKMH